MDVEVHNSLHHDLKEYERLFNPSIESVIGMHALAEFIMFDTQPPVRDPVRLLGAWANICVLGRDDYSADFLNKQIPYIERGTR